jgi:hypothetical protein
MRFFVLAQTLFTALGIALGCLVIQFYLRNYLPRRIKDRFAYFAFKLR